MSQPVIDPGPGVCQPLAADASFSVAAAVVPAYLCDDLDDCFTLVRADAACPFCAASKNRGALACYACYGAEVMRPVGGGDLVTLERRETELAAASALLSTSAPVHPASEAKPLFVPSRRRLRLIRWLTCLMLVCATTLMVMVGSLLRSVNRSTPRRATATSAAARQAPPPAAATAFDPRDVPMSTPTAGPPRITDENRRTAALLFVKTLYDVDRETRAVDLETALAMMTPESALRLAGELKESGMLERERRGGVRAWWQRELLEIDLLDSSVVWLRGSQVVDRAGRLPRLVIPMDIKVTFVEDPQGRTPQNQMTGLRISSFDVERAGPP